MNLRKKKQLIARTLGVGVDRITLNANLLEEIKQAITRQDIRELAAQGVIVIKELRGVKKKEKPGRRRMGSIRKKIKNRKRNYINQIRRERRRRTKNEKN